jgi:DeoR family transcriptional regulator of aga operon/DeoR family fructose operon transcriptional repressor
MREGRLRQILAILEQENLITVTELAERLEVAEMTIRRDLSELSRRGDVERTHGGAILSDRRGNRLEPPMLQRMDDQAEAKYRIGQAVASLVQPGETIFLGSGTTTLAVAQALAGRDRLTVITNALTVINALASSPGITVVVVGGFLRRDELSFIGYIGEATIESLRPDKVIIGIRGIHPRHGLTSDHLQELKTDQAILTISGDVILAADASKFGRIAASRTAPVTALHRIVTDVDAPTEMVEAIRAQGVEVWQV